MAEVARRYARSPKIESAPLQGETILFSPTANKFCVLNDTAAFMWQTLEKPSTLEELAGRLCEAYEVERSKALSDARDAIESLRALECVVEDGEAGLS